MNKWKILGAVAAATVLRPLITRMMDSSERHDPRAGGGFDGNTQTGGGFRGEARYDAGYGHRNEAPGGGRPQAQRQQSAGEHVDAVLDKLMVALRGVLSAIPQYEMPTVTEQGDIIIRRKTPREQPQPDQAGFGHDAGQGGTRW